MNLCVLRAWLRANFSSRVDANERGANMVEYILLVALIALAVIAAVVFLRSQLTSGFTGAGSTLSSAGN